MADKLWWGKNSGNEGDWGVAANWSASGVPAATDDIMIPAGSNAISGSLDQSAVALGEVEFSSGFDQAVGLYTASAPSYLILDCTAFDFSGTGESFVQLDKATAMTDVIIRNTFSPTTGKAGLYLKSTGGGAGDVTTLHMLGGTLGLGMFIGDAMTITNLKLVGGTVYQGPALGITNIDQTGGTFIGHPASTDGLTSVQINGGSYRIEGTGTITTLTVYGGTVTANGTGTITTLNLEGGTFDATQSLESRTITNLKHNGGTLKYDDETLTITNVITNDRPTSYSASQA